MNVETEKLVELKKMLCDRVETVKLCVDYLRASAALDFPVNQKFMGHEILSRREGLREACLLLELALSPEKGKAKKPKLEI